MKERLVALQAGRRRAIESGEHVVVGVNRYTGTETSPLTAGLDELAYEKVDPEHEGEQIENLQRFREQRDEVVAWRALDDLRRAAEDGDDLLPPSIAAALAGATTGEWADALRDVFGEYRAPTGVTGAAGQGGGGIADVRAKVSAALRRTGGGRLRMLVAKPGLDGHSNAAEQVAVRARDAGFEVIYQGIRLTPEQIARAAAEEDVDVVAVSILSGAHGWLVPEVLERLRAEGVDPERVPVVVGGVIPEGDERKLLELGVARVFTPKDYDLTAAIGEIADLIQRIPGL
jgi:ethylmalonyl-CoA mutase